MGFFLGGTFFSFFFFSSLFHTYGFDLVRELLLFLSVLFHGFDLVLKDVGFFFFVFFFWFVLLFWGFFLGLVGFLFLFFFTLSVEFCGFDLVRSVLCC